MENFRNQIHQDLSQEVLPQRQKKTKRNKKMSQMKILYDLPQGQLPQIEKRQRKPFFVFMWPDLPPQGRLHREQED